jgi:hypothetical protein
MMQEWQCAVQACVSGMFELKEDSAFKQHLRDFLVQTKSFADKNNADLYAEEAAAQREVRRSPTLQQDAARGPSPYCTDLLDGVKIAFSTNVMLSASQTSQTVDLAAGAHGAHLLWCGMQALAP